MNALNLHCSRIVIPVPFLFFFYSLLDEMSWNTFDFEIRKADEMGFLSMSLTTTDRVGSVRIKMYTR